MEVVVKKIYPIFISKRVNEISFIFLSRVPVMCTHMEYLSREIPFGIQCNFISCNKGL